MKKNIENLIILVVSIIICSEVLIKNKLVHIQLYNQLFYKIPSLLNPLFIIFYYFENKHLKIYRIRANRISSYTLIYIDYFTTNSFSRVYIVPSIQISTITL